MSSFLTQPAAHNIDQDLMNEIVQLMDKDTYSSLMELSGTEVSVIPYGSENLNTYAGPMDSISTGCPERGYRSENFDNYTGLIDSNSTGYSAGDYSSFRSDTEYSERGYSNTGRFAGGYGSYSNGTEYYENLQNHTGLIDSSAMGYSAGEYGSHNMFTAPHVPDTSSLSPQTPISSGYMYDNHSMKDYGYSNQEHYSETNTTYETQYLDISNTVPEQNSLSESKYDITQQDMLSIYSSNTDSHTSQGIYDHPEDLNTCENDQTWGILDDVEYKHVIPDQDMGYLSTGMDQLQLDTSFDNVKPIKGKTRTKKQPKDVNVSTDAMNVINKMIPGSGKRVRCPKNWEFLMRLLANPETNPSVICWEDRENYVFRLVEPEKIIELWNERTHKCSQTYDNFARGLRYHYQKGVLQPVPEKQLVYRCGPVAIQYFNNIGCS